MSQSSSVIAMVGILQGHGLSVELLQILVDHCQHKRTGGVSLYTSQGRFVRYEERSCGAVAVQDEVSLTNMRE